MSNNANQDRFVTVDQCREFGTGKLNIEHLAQLVAFEAMKSGNLQRFLSDTVLFGNTGEITLIEMRDLACELFTSVRSATYLGPLKRDRCMGYSSEAEERIVYLLNCREVPALDVATALGYTPPRPRRY